MRYRLSLSLFPIVISVGSSLATPINVPNFSFESPSVADNDSANVSESTISGGWTSTLFVHVDNPLANGQGNVGQGWSTPVPDGDQVLHMLASGNPFGVQSDKKISNTFVAGQTYVITVAVGNSFEADVPMHYALRAFWINGANSDYMTLKTHLTDPVENGEWREVTGTFTVAADSPAIGNGFIDLNPINGHGYDATDGQDEIYYDNFRVAVGTNINWNVNGSDEWSTGGNWTGGTAPNVIDVVANFGTVITSGATVHVASPQTVGIMNFSSPFSYNVGGTNASSITLAGSTGQTFINVTAGSHVISAPVVLGGDVNISTSGSTGLSITGPVSGAHSVSTSGTGTVQFSSVKANLLRVNSGTTLLSAKATNNEAATTSVLTSIKVSSGATLDLTNNSVIVDYSGTSPLASIRDNIKAGYASSSWSGTGISSSSAKTVAQGSSPRTAIAYAEASVLGIGNFNGQPLADSTAVVLMYTLSGDATLDGKVNTLDFNRLAGGFASGSDWTAGDFNYDGVVNSSDFDALVSTYGATLAAPSAALGAAVPEPGSAMLLVAALGIVKRKRR